MTPSACVLTGDIIGSSTASGPALDAAMLALQQAATGLEHWWPQGNPVQFTRFRGDGWHLVLADPRRSLRSALYLSSRLRAADTGLSSRIAIGLGSIETLGTQDLSDARGSAFLASGKALEKIRRGELMAIEGEGVTQLHEAVVALAAERTTKWSREQAEAIALNMASDAMTQIEAAQILGITPQATSARLSAGGYHALMSAIAFWEADYGAASG